MHPRLGPRSHVGARAKTRPLIREACSRAEEASAKLQRMRQRLADLEGEAFCHSCLDVTVQCGVPGLRISTVNLFIVCSKVVVRRIKLDMGRYSLDFM